MGTLIEFAYPVAISVTQECVATASKMAPRIMRTVLNGPSYLIT